MTQLAAHQNKNGKALSIERLQKLHDEHQDSPHGPRAERHNCLQGRTNQLETENPGKTFFVSRNSSLVLVSVWSGRGFRGLHVQAWDRFAYCLGCHGSWVGPNV
eukprot:6295443-Amphidinium_carterae.1